MKITLTYMLAGLPILCAACASAGPSQELKSARDHGADEAKVIPLLGRTYMVQGKFDQVLQEFPVKDNAPPAVRIATLTVRAEARHRNGHVGAQGVIGRFLVAERVERFFAHIFAASRTCAVCRIDDNVVG